MSRDSSLPVRLELPTATRGNATLWEMSGESIGSDNELAHDVEVQIEEQALSGFLSGYRRSLPPHSMTVVRWVER